MASRQRNRRLPKRTSPVPSPMTTIPNEAPAVQDNLQLEAEVVIEEESLPPTIADLDCITDENQLAKIFDALDQEDGDGGDSDKEGEECEIHDKAITKSMLNRHTHKDDFLACENISAGDIAFVVGKKEVMDVIPDKILETVQKPPLHWVPPAK